MKKEKLPVKQLLALIIGELLVSAVVVSVFLIVKIFKEDIEIYKVILGAALGSVVTVLNFTFLALMTNRAINAFLEERGNAEMDEEAALAVLANFQGKIQNQIKISFIVRTLVLVATLVAAFLINIFNVIATVVPLLAFRPIIIITELVGRRAKMKNMPAFEIPEDGFAVKDENEASDSENFGDSAVLDEAESEDGEK